jgi:hypothetical protein
MSFSHQTARLARGRHARPEEGVCVMELASVLAGQKFSDHPHSVSPLLCELLLGYNDGLDDDRRQTLKRFAATVLGTAGTVTSERDRGALLRAFIAQCDPGGRPWARVRRSLLAARPYLFAYRTGRDVASQGDDALHARMCALLDAVALHAPRVAATSRDGRGAGGGGREAR